MRALRSGNWLAVAAVLVAIGCTRASFRTEIHPDGSWTRTERFSEEGLREAFSLPKGGGWMVNRVEEKEGASHIARRTLRPGETLRRDLVVERDEAGTARRRLASEVTLRDVDGPRPQGARRWQLREVLRWHGPRPQPFLDRERELQRILQAGLPEGLASEADREYLVRQTLREAWRVLTGPDEAWQVGAGHAEFGERHARMRLGIAIDRLLAGKFGRRLTLEERREVVRKLVAAVPLTMEGDGQENSDWFDANEAGRIPLMFVVKVPGRLVTTNGTFDPVTGEVLWGLYAAAPALEEVVLTATGEPEVEKEEGAARAGSSRSEK